METSKEPLDIHTTHPGPAMLELRTLIVSACCDDNARKHDQIRLIRLVDQGMVFKNPSCFSYSRSLRPDGDDTPWTACGF